MRRPTGSEPDRIQLYFCLGLINYYAKLDCDAAKRDLSEFLSKLKEGDFPRQADIARELLVDCESRLKLAIAVV